MWNLQAHFKVHRRSPQLMDVSSAWVLFIFLIPHFHYNKEKLILKSACMDLLELLCALSVSRLLFDYNKKGFVMDINWFSILDCLDLPKFKNNKTFVHTHYHSFICFKWPVSIPSDSVFLTRTQNMLYISPYSCARSRKWAMFNHNLSCMAELWIKFSLLCLLPLD